MARGARSGCYRTQASWKQRWESTRKITKLKSWANSEGDRNQDEHFKFVGMFFREFTIIPFEISWTGWHGEYDERNSNLLIASY